MQFHQSAHLAGEFSVRQSAVLPFGAQRIHPARFHRAGRDIRHRLAREDARAIVLRWLVAADHRPAAGRMPKRAIAPRRPRLRDREERRRLCRHDGSGRISRPLAGGRHRRAIDPENGRQRIRLQDRRTIRSQDRAAARGAGAADLRRGHAGAVQGFVRHIGRCDRELRQGAFRRGAAVYPSRLERPGDPADIVLLARGRRHRHRHGAGPRCPRAAETTAARPSAAGIGDGAGRVSSQAARADHRRQDRRSRAACGFFRPAAVEGRPRL